MYQLSPKDGTTRLALAVGRLRPGQRDAEVRVLTHGQLLWLRCKRLRTLVQVQQAVSQRRQALTEASR